MAIAHPFRPCAEQDLQTRSTDVVLTGEEFATPPPHLLKSGQAHGAVSRIQALQGGVEDTYPGGQLKTPRAGINMTRKSSDLLRRSLQQYRTIWSGTGKCANASGFEQNTTNYWTQPHSLLVPSSLKIDTDPDNTGRMCGVDVDLEDEGAGEEEKEQEEETGVGERVRMLPPLTAHSGAEAWGGRRGLLGRLSCGAALVLWNMAVAVACVLVLAGVFALVLLPATLLLCAGFLCHSRVLNSSSPLCRYLDDNSCSALIILGFVMMSPLVVVAAAAFCSVVRRLRLLLLFQPMARACYRGGGWGRNVQAWV
ncbi:hypothetical protein AAFF_G00144610 [Aldrovandia affinis]|uniref:Transmembrane protein 88 n=1 Tax=Aldrovandia affinis TaxID=143900 RepID=A0AAD7T0K4_9TELE|nr:hypothetical protein AAFF_G00144610 [Aldrovandia affinis]